MFGKTRKIFTLRSFFYFLLSVIFLFPLSNISAAASSIIVTLNSGTQYKLKTIECGGNYENSGICGIENPKKCPIEGCRCTPNPCTNPPIVTHCCGNDVCEFTSPGVCFSSGEKYYCSYNNERVTKTCRDGCSNGTCNTTCHGTELTQNNITLCWYPVLDNLNVSCSSFCQDHGGLADQRNILTFLDNGSDPSPCKNLLSNLLTLTPNNSIATNSDSTSCTLKTSNNTIAEYTYNSPPALSTWHTTDTLNTSNRWIPCACNE